MTIKNCNKNIIISFFVLLSYIFLFFYTPSHILSMNKNHHMNMQKEDCPFIEANNILCRSLIKIDNELNLTLFNNKYISVKNILIFSYIEIYILYTIKKIRNKEDFKIPILLKKLFYKGILNSKAY